MALGSEHSICLATDNTLWAWGWNEHCNTGISSQDNILKPTLMPLDISKNSLITQIYSGSAHNFIVVEESINIETNSNANESHENGNQL